MSGWIAPVTARTGPGAKSDYDDGTGRRGMWHIGLRPARYTPRRLALLTALTLLPYAGTGQTQNAPAGPAYKIAPPSTQPEAEDLNDLNAVTFECAKAGLNAAAREASKVPSQGTYQFTFFKIVNDSHHSFYEVHFKSNYQGEADLKYCVAVYCQQGWDQKTTNISVQRMGGEDSGKRAGAHPTGCGHMRPRGKSSVSARTKPDGHLE